MTLEDRPLTPAVDGGMLVGGAGVSAAETEEEEEEAEEAVDVLERVANAVVGESGAPEVYALEIGIGVTLSRWRETKGKRGSFWLRSSHGKIGDLDCPSPSTIDCAIVMIRLCSEVWEMLRTERAFSFRFSRDGSGSARHTIDRPS